MGIGIATRAVSPPQPRVDVETASKDHFEAVGVSGTFADQGLELAAEPAPILLFGARHPDHRADAGLAPLVRQQRPDQHLAVDPVGLRPAMPALDRDRGGIDDVALDALLVQCAVDPEAIEPGLSDDDDRE